MDPRFASSAQEYYHRNVSNIPFIASYLPYSLNNLHQLQILSLSPYLVTVPVGPHTIPSLFGVIHPLNMPLVNSSTSCKSESCNAVDNKIRREIALTRSTSSTDTVNNHTIAENEIEVLLSSEENNSTEAHLTPSKQERQLKHSLSSDLTIDQNSIKRKKESLKRPAAALPLATLPVAVCHSFSDISNSNNKNSNSLEHVFTNAPWKPSNKNYNENGLFLLHTEILDFHTYISPTNDEQCIRQQVVDRIENIVLDLWPDAKVDVFGSFKTGLYLPSSDIDIVIFGQWNSSPLYQLQKILEERGISKNIKVLDRASVPIVKFTDSQTDIRVDISYNMMNGIHSVNFIRSCMKKYKNLSYLVLVLKQFLLQRDLNEVWTGGISSYSLILMCISFLQHARNCDRNLGVLLVEFFEYYAFRFNYYNTAIRVTNNGSLVSKHLVQRHTDAGPGASILCIEDPLQPGNDIARSSYGVFQVRAAFEHAYLALVFYIQPNAISNCKKSSILAKIIQVSDAVIKYRTRLSDLYASLPSPPESSSENNCSDSDASSSISEPNKADNEETNSQVQSSDQSDSEASSPPPSPTSKDCYSSRSYANVASSAANRLPGEGQCPAIPAAGGEGVRRRQTVSRKESAARSISSSIERRDSTIGECSVGGFPAPCGNTTRLHKQSPSPSYRGTGRYYRRNGYQEWKPFKSRVHTTS